MRILGVIFLLLSFVFSNINLSAQSPYELKPAKEISLFGGGLALFGLGYYQRTQTSLYSLNDLENLDPNSINSFDRNAVNNFSLAAHHASDYFWYSSFSAPLLFLAGKESRKDIKKISMIWGEVLFLNAGLTVFTKYTARRTRPFVYNNAAPIDKKLVENAKGSFFSGHTSMTAANTFFVASVFQDYYPNSNWKPVVWGAAAVIPAITGYLRVKGGRHFPTDVITGYVVGAAVGYFVPKLHKKKKTEQPKF